MASLGLSQRIGTFVADHPVLIAAAFAGLLAASTPAIMGLQVYLSIYELSPRGEYYDHFVTLNSDLGWDNLGALLITLPEERSHRNVTDPPAVREMNEVEVALEELPFVESVLSLAKLVRIMSGRPEYMVEQATPTPLHQLLPENATTGGFPEEGAAGDAQINLTLTIALEALGDQIYGNLLSPDHKSALMVVVLDTGATGEEYRAWQRELLHTGLALDESNRYAGETEMRPLSIDIIYSTLDDITITEGPWWLVTAALTAIGTVVFLFRRVSDTVSAVVVLLIVVAATLAVSRLQGIDFNLLSLLVAALIFAAGVDYAMHVIARYREERRLGHDSRAALVTAMRSSGSALLVTSITTTGGFASLYFSEIPAIGDFGVMVGGAIFAAFLACLTLLLVLLVWSDSLREVAFWRKREDAPVDAPPSGLAARRLERVEKVRQEQRESLLGRLGAWLAERPGPVIGASALTLVLVASPMLTSGISVWGASYLEPYTIFDEETYPMEALRMMDATFGIPNEIAVLFYGDPTDPEVVDFLDRFQQHTEGVHGRTKTDSVPNVLRLYTTIINPDPSIDRDRDGIPDTQKDIRRAFDEMRVDPATSVLVSRIVVYDAEADRYTLAAHRLGINPQPANTLGQDIDNYRATREDVEAALDAMRSEENRLGLTHGTTGLVVLGIEVVDAIVRGNAMSVLIMLAVVYGVLLLFWRKPDLALVGMVPIFAAVVVQYGLTAHLGYEVTYVSLILTGMVMGIGVDDAVHYINRFREEIRRGKAPREAATLASAEIGSVLVGTTITTMSPFIAILTSVLTWAVQTALLVIPTLLAALLATVLTLPALLAWHARVRPRAYGVAEVPADA